MSLLRDSENDIGLLLVFVGWIGVVLVELTSVLAVFGVAHTALAFLSNESLDFLNAAICSSS